jgi:2-oxoglutarate dehydrogenase E1 component
MDAIRRWGWLEANLDPLGRLAPAPHPDVPREHPLRAVYCGSVGAEFMHVASPERVRWIADRMEAPPAPVDRARVLELLVRADAFEKTLQSRYPGSKRFSLEGLDALVPLLDAALARAASLDATHAVLATAHRGRLNVIVNVVGRPARDVFAGFEDVDPRSVLGSGDVKYHLGATGTAHGLRVSLVSNPSHLEVVAPVAMGRARAKATRAGSARGVLPVTMHGDAAFAGQGVTAETLNLADLAGYTVGGTIHVVLNNLIGFTTGPASLHSSRFATSLARRLDVPIFHVNGEDADAVVRVARMAVDFRAEFASDVVIDLVGFRRHGHSELDDPTTTWPLLYRAIAKRPPLWKAYGEGLEIDSRVRAEYAAALDEARALTKSPPLYELPEYWSPYRGGAHDPSLERPTGADCARALDAITRVPDGFHVHPKVASLMTSRREAKRVDWALAESLAFGTLLAEGVRVRLTGQDVRRGTFNQRHAVLVDVETGAEHAPLASLGAFECHDSPLSEAAVLGFEYGFSRDFPEALVLWEAQFGDFANVAQAVIDQFIAAGEDKWGLLSGLVLLLPHGYEGQGPEHSSARIERFLQLAGEDAIVVAQPTTAAQYFHLLRRQALRKWRKPLVVFTPKSMLRHPGAASPIEELATGRFEPVLADRDVRRAFRVLVCTGKIAHELRAEREKRAAGDVAIVTIEELYPFPDAALEEALKPYERQIVWVQEEPANVGALGYVTPHLERIAGQRPFRSIKRAASASPATGSSKAHAIEQQTLMDLAFAVPESRMRRRTDA